MATSGLNYMISVQLDRLVELQKLHDTIVAIQQLSGKGAEFDVRVTAQSLDDLSKKIGQAVGGGFSRGAARVEYTSGGGGGGGGGDKGEVSVNTSTLEGAINKLAAIVGGMGARPGVQVAGAVARRPGATIGSAAATAIQQQEELLTLLDDVIFKRVEETKDVRARILRGLGKSTNRNIERVLGKIDTGDAGEDALLREEVLSPVRLRDQVARRLGSMRKRFGASAVSSASPGDAAVSFAIDASLLTKSFETGAASLADAMRKGIADATAGMARAITDAVRAGLRGGGQFNDEDDRGFTPVSEDDKAWGSRAFRATAYGTSPEDLRRSRLYQTESRDTTRASMTFLQGKLEEDERKYGGLQEMQKKGATIKGIEGLAARIAERRKEIERLVGEEQVATRHLEQIDAQIAQTTGTIRPNQMSRRQLSMAQATWDADPGSHESLAQRRGADYLRNLTSREADIFRRAADAGVMTLPKVFERMSARTTSSPAIKAMGEERDALLLERRVLSRQYKETPVDKRQEVGAKLEQVQRKIEALEARTNDRLFGNANRSIDSAAGEYRARLELERDQVVNDPKLTMEQRKTRERELNRKIGELAFSRERVGTLVGENPNLQQEALLIPRALAQYVRDTMTRYATALKQMASGKAPAIPEDLKQELQSNTLLTTLAGRLPDNPREAAGAFAGVRRFQREFNDAKTAFELTRPRGVATLPQFNPDLGIDTAPFLDGNRDVPDRSVRERQLAYFVSRGGAFAPQTEERRAYAEKMFRQYEKMAQEDPKNFTDTRRESMLEWQREMEFGGRYFLRNSPMGMYGAIQDDVLLAPSEKKYMEKGGVRSRVMPNPLQGVNAAGQTMSAETTAAKRFLDTMNGVEAALSRINKTMSELSVASFDPVIKEFQRLGETLRPYAEMLGKVKGVLDTVAGPGAMLSVKAADRQMKQEIQTKGELERLQNRLAYGSSSTRSAQANIDLPTLTGSAVIPAASLPLGTDPAVLRELVLRGRNQIGTSQMRMQDLQAMYDAQLGAQAPTKTTAAQIARNSVQTDALMMTFARNVQALTTADPTFFKGRNQDVSATAEAVIQAAQKRNLFGDQYRALLESEQRIKSIQAERTLLTSGKSTLDGQAKRRVSQLNEAEGRLKDFSEARIGDLSRITGLDRSQLSAERLKVTYGQLNTELGTYYDRLMKTTQASVDHAEAGGTMMDRVVNKFRNLAAYMMAGGILYTIANSIRQASAAAVQFETDLRNIQGVLETRSAGQAATIGAGVFGAAAEYGVSVNESMRSAKLFAQTGASAGETVALTRASLAAQIGAGLDAQQATEMLIAVQNITDRQTTAFDILDRISRIESQYAVSAQDLSSAIQRAGSLAQQLQPQALGAVDALDLVIGASTAIIERTRVTGEQAATSLRFIFSRLGAPEVAKALQERFQINLAGDNPNELRPLQDILSDIAARYQQLKESGQTVQAQQLLTTFAGARQSNVAAALLEDFNTKVLKVAGEAALAYGDTQERVALRLDTVSASLAQFQTSLTKLAFTLFNDTGVSTVLKAGLKGSAAFLDGLSSPAGAVATGGVAATVAVLSSQLAPRLMQVASNAGGGLLSAAAARGAGLVAGVGGWAGPLAAISAGVATLVTIVQWFQDRANREEVKKADEFDLKAFQDSEFYKEYEARSVRYGLSANELSATVRKAFLDSAGSVQQQVDRGATPQNQQYNETINLLVRTLSETLPGFANIGNSAQLASEALALVRSTATFGLAVPDTITAGLRKDMANLFSEVDRNIATLSSTLANTRYEDIDRFERGEPTTVSKLLPFSFDAFFKQFTYAGEQFLRAGELRAPGTRGTFADLQRSLPRGQELQALDRYARANLLVNPAQSAQIKAAEERLRRDGKEVTPTAIIQSAAEANKLSVTQQGELSAANYRLGNQRQLAADLIGEINAALGNDGDSRIAALRRGLGEVTEGDRAGNAFVQSFRDAVALAQAEILKTAEAVNENEAGMKEYKEALETLNTALTRASQQAAVTTKTSEFAIRDRLFEPISQYVSRLSEIGTESRLANRFGTSYDEVAARAQAARQYIVSLEQVPNRLLTDRARLAAGLVSGGASAVDGVRLRQIQFSEEGGLAAVGRGSQGAVISDDDTIIAGALAGRKADIDKLKAMAREYNLAQQEGLKGLFEYGKTAKEGTTIREAITELRKVFDDYKALINNTKDAATVARLLEQGGTIAQRSAAALEALTNEIVPEIARAQRLTDAQALSDTLGAAAQAEFTVEQARLQGQLGRNQINPISPYDAVQTQLDINMLARNKQTQDLQRLYDLAMAQADELTGSTDQQNARDKAERDYAAGVTQANRDRLAADYTAATSLDAQLTRRNRDEAVQLVQNITDPIRTFLMSSQNFSQQGYKALAEGVGQAAQQRLVDMFMRPLFSETGLLGSTLANAFSTGALSTETAIERGFRVSIDRLVQALNSEVRAPSAGLTGVAVPSAQSSSNGAAGSTTPSAAFAQPPLSGRSAVGGASALPRIEGISPATVRKVLDTQPIATIASADGMSGLGLSTPPKKPYSTVTENILQRPRPIAPRDVTINEPGVGPAAGGTAMLRAPLDFLPGIGEALSAYDFKNAARDGDKLGMTLSALGVVGVPKPVANLTKPFMSTLFSRLGRAVTDAPFEKGTGAQWLAQTSKNVAQGERTWTGLDAVFTANPERIFTKSEVDRIVAEMSPAVDFSYDSKYWEFIQPGPAQDYKEHLFSLKTRSPDERQYRDGHFGEDNFLHLRTTQRSTPDGIKLGVEEIQSDAHQQARKLVVENDPASGVVGYSNLEQMRRQAAEFESLSFKKKDIQRQIEDSFHALQRRATSMMGKGPDQSFFHKQYSVFGEMNQKFDDFGFLDDFEFSHKPIVTLEDVQYSRNPLINARLKADPEIRNLESVIISSQYELQDVSKQLTGGLFKKYAIPDLPFKKTEEWTELALKKAIHEAARVDAAGILFPTPIGVSAAVGMPRAAAERFYGFNSVNPKTMRPEPGIVQKTLQNYLKSAGVTDAIPRAVTDMRGFSWEIPMTEQMKNLAQSQRFWGASPFIAAGAALRLSDTQEGTAGLGLSTDSKATPGDRVGAGTLSGVVRLQKQLLGEGDPAQYGLEDKKIPRYLPPNYFSPEQQALLRRQGVKSMENMYYNSAGILLYDPKKKTGPAKVNSHMVFANAPLEPGETFDAAEQRASKTVYPLLPSPSGQAAMNTLDPDARPYFEDLLAKARARGLKVEVNEALRPLQNNLEYLRTGASWTLTSRHSMGTAIDLTSDSDYSAVRKMINEDPYLRDEVFNTEIEGDKVHFEIRAEALLKDIQAAASAWYASQPSELVRGRGRTGFGQFRTDMPLSNDPQNVSQRDSVMVETALRALDSLSAVPISVQKPTMSQWMNSDIGAVPTSAQKPTVYQWMNANKRRLNESNAAYLQRARANVLQPSERVRDRGRTDLGQFRTDMPLSNDPQNVSQRDSAMVETALSALDSSLRAVPLSVQKPTVSQRTPQARQPVSDTRTPSIEEQKRHLFDKYGITDDDFYAPKLDTKSTSALGDIALGTGGKFGTRSPFSDSLQARQPVLDAQPRSIEAQKRYLFDKYGITDDDFYAPRLDNQSTIASAVAAVAAVAAATPTAPALPELLPTIGYQVPSLPLMNTTPLRLPDSYTGGLTQQQLEIQQAVLEYKKREYQSNIDAQARSVLGLDKNTPFSFSTKYGSWGQAIDSALPLAGSLIGSQIGPKDRPSYASEGASVGAMLGNIVAPGFGGLIGGLLGGGLGSLLGKDEDTEPQLTALEAIERNTRTQIEAVENQTRVLQLDNRFLNVPAGFVVPQFRPFGAGDGGNEGANVTMNITVNGAPGQSESELATLVASAIRNELRGAGSAFDIRR